MASLMSTEVLKNCRSKWIHFQARRPAFHLRTSGLKQGPAFAVKLVSDSLKLDILVTKASPHFPRLKGGSLSLPGWHPAPLCFRAFSYIIHYTHGDRCPQCWLVYTVRIVRWGKNRQFSPTLSFSSSAVSPMCFHCKLSLAATVRGRWDTELEA